MAIIGLIVATSLQAQSGDWPPPLKITGTVTRKIFKLGSSVPINTEQSKVSVYSSNSWWRIQTTSVSGRAASMDYMRISEGTRYYAVPEVRNIKGTNILPYAISQRILSPPPEQVESLLAWLAFTPRPELPLIDSDHIHRFIESKLQDHPQNQGTFSAGYIEPKHVFLSNLSITNDGKVFAPSGEILHASPPFENGWLEFQYKATQTTNVLGYELPATASIVKFSTKPDAQQASDIYERVVFTIQLETVEALDKSNEPQVEPKIVAADARPTGLKKAESIVHAVQDDKWQKTSDPEIQSRVRAAEANAARAAIRKPSTAKRLYWTRTALVGLVALPVIFLGWYAYARKK